MSTAFRLRKGSASHADEAGELNVIPYLDILMNLIIFVLLSMTGLATWGVVNATAPALARPGDAPASPPVAQVSVRVSRAGFSVATADEVVFTTPTLDPGALRAGLVKVKATMPAVTRVFIAPDADVPFETLVATMDATRETDGHQALFPDVSLAVPR